MSLAVESTGPVGSPALVLLHGIGTSGWMWWRQVPAFPHYRCLVVDLPGHGRSNGVPWVSLADTADRVAAVIRSDAPGQRVHVVGLSLGGQVGLTLLERYPELVETAVLSGVTVEPWPHRWAVPLQASITARSMRSPRIIMAQARSLGLPPEMHEPFARTLLAMTGRTWRRIHGEVAAYGLPTMLRTVETPTLVVAGTTEAAIIRRAVADLPAAMPAAVGRLVPNVGHGWNVEAPDLFNSTVRAWVERSPLPGNLLLPDQIQ